MPVKLAARVQRTARLVPHVTPASAVSATAVSPVQAAEAAPAPSNTADSNVHGTSGAVTLDKRRAGRAEKLRNIVFVSSEVR